MDIVRALHRTPSFADLSKSELAALAQITKQRHYRRHQAIIEAGERGDDFFLLTDGAMLELHFTRQELAALAGVSRETFARLLTKFQQIGVLTIERRRLFISDLHRLEELS